MSNISAKQVKELRERTGSGMMECKKALQEAEGDVDEAVTILRKKGQAVAEKKSGRATTEGLVESYVHPGGRVGVLIDNDHVETVLRCGDRCGQPSWTGADD